MSHESCLSERGRVRIRIEPSALIAETCRLPSAVKRMLRSTAYLEQDDKEQRLTAQRPRQSADFRPPHAVTIPHRHGCDAPCTSSSVSHCSCHSLSWRANRDRQREANRAPPTVVLSLPERVWAPDIVWEKDDSESDKDEAPPPGDDNSKTKPKSKPKPKKIPEETATDLSAGSVVLPAAAAAEAGEGTTATAQGDSDASAVTTRSADADDEGDTATTAPVDPPRRRGKERRKSKRYYSKDECAICMDNFHKGEIVRILPCGHVFHKDECDEWLLKWRKLVRVMCGERMSRWASNRPSVRGFNVVNREVEWS